jgi:hypothetical protein
MDRDGSYFTTQDGFKTLLTQVSGARVGAYNPGKSPIKDPDSTALDQSMKMLINFNRRAISAQLTKRSVTL